VITIEGNSRTVAILGSGKFNDSRGLSRDVRAEFTLDDIQRSVGIEAIATEPQISWAVVQDEITTGGICMGADVHCLQTYIV